MLTFTAIIVIIVIRQSHYYVLYCSMRLGASGHNIHSAALGSQDYCDIGQVVIAQFMGEGNAAELLPLAWQSRFSSSRALKETHGSAKKGAK